MYVCLWLWCESVIICKYLWHCFIMWDHCNIDIQQYPYDAFLKKLHMYVCTRMSQLWSYMYRYQLYLHRLFLHVNCNYSG